MDNADKIRAYLKLTLAEGIGAKIFSSLVEAFGSVEAAGVASGGALGRIRGIGPAKVQAIQAVTAAMVDDELAHAYKFGVEIICLEDEAYPEALKTIFDPPAVLYVRGQLLPDDAVAMAVVGSRRCTHYGMEQAERFGALLGRAGFTVVSGGARGIDTAAHRGSLASGGRTVAVMGCGLAQTYPRENAELFERIIAEDRGAIISELPMRTAVLAGNFPTRNRIVSGLSLGTLVIEAALPSGALITARVAAEQGRDVFALPGRVDSPLSAGTHQLLRDGAHLAGDLDDILGPLGEVGQQIQPDEPLFQTPPSLTGDELAILQALACGPKSLDALVQQTGLETARVASCMTMLVIKGAVVQRPGNVFARNTRRASH
jgi:DNA processing protein